MIDRAFPAEFSVMPKLTLGQFFRQYFVYLLPSVVLIYIVLESYQIDFRPYYVAGRSILLGLDPYLNPVNDHPALFTPVNGEDRPWSGFIYPPFAALLFVPFAMMSYGTAKIVYSSVVLIVLWLLMFQLVRNNLPRLNPAAIVLCMGSFPAIASFERGQIDIIVCALTMTAFYTYENAKKKLLPGVLLAIACGIKIFPFVALIYFLVKRQFKLVFTTLAALFLLLGLPFLYFGSLVYQNYLKRLFPEVFGEITAPGPISVHGQDIVNRVVLAIEGNKLWVTHDFVHGYMNPLMRGKTGLAMAIGLGVFALIWRFVKGRSNHEQFVSLINTLHVFNPQAWIMGMVWYFPFVIFQFNNATDLGRLILLLPLFLPPSTNINMMLSIVVTLLFALPRSRTKLLQTPTE
jgi:Glycosyltransferase family 87